MTIMCFLKNIYVWIFVTYELTNVLIISKKICIMAQICPKESWIIYRFWLHKNVKTSFVCGLNNVFLIIRENLKVEESIFYCVEGPTLYWNRIQFPFTKFRFINYITLRSLGEALKKFSALQIIIFTTLTICWKSFIASVRNARCFKAKATFVFDFLS